MYVCGVSEICVVCVWWEWYCVACVGVMICVYVCVCVCVCVMCAFCAPYLCGDAMKMHVFYYLVSIAFFPGRSSYTMPVAFCLLVSAWHRHHYTCMGHSR